jgi:hypothetical protein
MNIPGFAGVGFIGLSPEIQVGIGWPQDQQSSLKAAFGRLSFSANETAHGPHGMASLICAAPIFI